MVFLVCLRKDLIRFETNSNRVNLEFVFGRFVYKGGGELIPGGLAVGIVGSSELSEDSSNGC